MQGWRRQAPFPGTTDGYLLIGLIIKYKPMKTRILNAPQDRRKKVMKLE